MNKHLIKDGAYMKALSGVLGAIITVFIANGVVAGTISSSQVGAVDDLIAWTKLSNSGDQTEINWVNTVLGGNNILEFKNDLPNPASSWMLVTGTNDTYAYYLNTPVSYFLIKTGNNGNNQPRDFLYKNIGNPDYAVIDLDLQGLGDDISSIANIGKLSHIDGFDSLSSTVPEPSAMILFGACLTGLAAFVRRKRS
jgi:hypothetical protein